MLVRIGHAGAINMRGIDRVIITIEQEKTYPNSTWFSKGSAVTKTTYVLIIDYTNADGEKTQQRFTCPDEKTADTIKDVVLSQAKELENVGATQALEEAIRNV